VKEFRGQLIGFNYFSVETRAKSIFELELRWPDQSEFLFPHDKKGKITSKKSNYRIISQFTKNYGLTRKIHIQCVKKMQRLGNLHHER